MDFLAQAGSEFGNRDCLCCEHWIFPDDAVRYDVDLVGDAPQARVLHAVCWDYVREQVNEAKRNAYVDAAQTVRASSTTDLAYGFLMTKAKGVGTEQADPEFYLSLANWARWFGVHNLANWAIQRAKG